MPLARSLTTPIDGRASFEKPQARKTIAVPNKDGVARAEQDHEKRPQGGFTNVPPRARRFGVSSGHVSTSTELFPVGEATNENGISNAGLDVNIPTWDDKSREDMIILRSALRNPIDKRMRLLFDEASPELLDSILRSMRARSVPKDANVVVENGHQMNCFVVKHGVFEVFRKEKLIDYALVGFSMGACTLLHGCDKVERAPWTITSTADDCEIWELDSETYRALVVKDATEKFDSKYACIKKCDILTELTEAERLKLAEVVEFESFVDEEIIVEQGERDDKMFIVKSGRAVAFINGEQGPVMVKTYEMGDFFGEIALLMNEPRRASVVSEGPCECLYIDRETFSRTLGPCVNILKRNIDKYSAYNNILENLTAEDGEGIDRFVSEENSDKFDITTSIPRCASDLDEETSHAKKKSSLVVPGGAEPRSSGRLSGKGRSLSLMHTGVGSLGLGLNSLGDGAKEEEWLSNSKNPKAKLKKKGTFSLKNVFADGWQEVDSDEEDENVVSENQSLAERVNADFKRSAVVEPHLRIFPCQTIGLFAFGGLLQGEKFIDNKKVWYRNNHEITHDESGAKYFAKMPRVTSRIGPVVASVICNKGQKKSFDPSPNQDNFFIHFDEENGYSSYGMFDGHGPFGHLASFRLVQSIPHYIKNDASIKANTNVEAALKNIFKKADEDLTRWSEKKKINLEASGSTGTVLVVIGEDAYFCWIGDSTAMLASWHRHDSRLLFETPVHKPENKEENARIKECGGEVRELAPGHFRVFLEGQNFPGLTMSRSFGDYSCKNIGVRFYFYFSD